MAQTIRSRIEAAAKRLGKHRQGHLVRFVDRLSRDEKVRLLDDLDGLDLDLIDELIGRYVLHEPAIDLPGEVLPPPVYPASPTPAQQDRHQHALTRGEQLIAEHRVAAFTVAGGQGTRLNFDGPKGNLPVTPLRNQHRQSRRHDGGLRAE